MMLSLTPKAQAALGPLLRAPQRYTWAVYGLGIAGRSMAMYLRQRGAEVVGVDDNPALPRADYDNAGIELRLGPTEGDPFAGCDAVAIAPGVDPRNPRVQTFMQRDRPVVGELCLGQEYRGRILAITGTNGKSTTTALAGALCRGAGLRSFVGGNLGTPFLQIFAAPSVDVAVLELSSYQLETAYVFAPDVGVVLNVTPDHAERYADFAAYAATKEILVRQVAPRGRVILSADDPVVVAMAASAKAPVWWFSTQKPTLPGDGVCVVGDRLVPQGSLTALGEVPLTHPYLLGRHNRENAAAAFLAVHALSNMPAATLLPAYGTFRGLEHRLEVVADVGGVIYINDSKATNDASAAIAVRAIERPTWVLVGGKDKGGGYALLRQAAQEQRVRGVVAFGAAAKAVTEAFGGSSVPLHAAGSMEQALMWAHGHAQPGDAILLSPACASFDAFDNYMHRGRVFKALVQALPKAAP